jgi:hypothetical protein
MKGVCFVDQKPFNKKHLLNLLINMYLMGMGMCQSLVQFMSHFPIISSIYARNHREIIVSCWTSSLFFVGNHSANHQFHLWTVFFSLIKTHLTKTHIKSLNKRVFERGGNVPIISSVYEPFSSIYARNHLHSFCWHTLLSCLVFVFTRSFKIMVHFHNKNDLRQILVHF